MYPSKQLGVISLSEAGTYAKRALPIGLTGMFAGAILYPMASLISAGATPSFKEIGVDAAVGAGAGFILAEGIGILFKAGQDGRMASTAVAAPMVFGGGAATILRTPTHLRTIPGRRSFRNRMARWQRTRHGSILPSPRHIWTGTTR